MNGLDLLLQLGIQENSIAAPGSWALKPSETAFFEFLQTPLGNVLSATGRDNVTRLPMLDGAAGILKGCTVFEVVSYRDVSKPLPLAKALESTGEEVQPQFTTTRTLKLLLTDGTPDRNFVAMEYEPCPMLDAVRIGAKIQVKDCYYHHGILLLSPNSCKFLGAPESPFENSAAA